MKDWAVGEQGLEGRSQQGGMFTSAARLVRTKSVRVKLISQLDRGTSVQSLESRIFQRVRVRRWDDGKWDALRGWFLFVIVQRSGGLEGAGVAL